MTHWQPLRFKPIYRQYLWGGTRIRTYLGRDLDPAATHAESWELCDHGDDQSVVQDGPLAGTTLHELVRHHRAEILGEHARWASPTLADRRFPLLIKFLDAEQNLSLQVHPDDAMAARLTPPDLGKTEAWVVLDARPGSLIYAGLREGVDRATLARAIEQGTCCECLHAFEAQPGDCVFLPAGTVHALGAGLLIAEVQQASDTTFRLFDWNRVGPDGKPRPLHVQQGLDATHFDMPPVEPVRLFPMGQGDEAVDLVRCNEFVLRRHAIVSSHELGGDGRFHILIVLEGELTVEDDPAGVPLSRGQTILLPAALGATRLTPQGRAVFLEAQPGD